MVWVCDICKDQMDHAAKRFYDSTTGNYLCFFCMMNFAKDKANSIAEVVQSEVTGESVVVQKLEGVFEYQGHPVGTPPVEGLNGYYVDEKGVPHYTPCDITVKCPEGPTGPVGYPGFSGSLLVGGGGGAAGYSHSPLEAEKAEYNVGTHYGTPGHDTGEDPSVEDQYEPGGYTTGRDEDGEMAYALPKSRLLYVAEMIGLIRRMPLESLVEAFKEFKGRWPIMYETVLAYANPEPWRQHTPRLSDEERKAYWDLKTNSAPEPAIVPTTTTKPSGHVDIFGRLKIGRGVPDSVGQPDRNGDVWPAEIERMLKDGTVTRGVTSAGKPVYMLPVTIPSARKPNTLYLNDREIPLAGTSEQIVDALNNVLPFHVLPMRLSMSCNTNPCNEIPLAGPELDHDVKMRKADQDSDELKKQMGKLQFIMGGQISSTGGLKAVGIDYRREVERIAEEQRFGAEQQAKLQEEMEHAQQAQAAETPLFKDVAVEAKPEPKVKPNIQDRIQKLIDDMKKPKPQPVLMPDINTVATDIFQLKKMFLKYFNMQGIDLPPGILDEPKKAEPVDLDADIAARKADEEVNTTVARMTREQEYEQWYFRMLKLLVGDHAIHFQTGPGYSEAELRHEIMMHMPKFPSVYPTGNDAEDFTDFRDCWFNVIGQFRREGKITRDYTDYIVRRLPPMNLMPDDVDQNPTDTPVRIADDGSVEELELTIDMDKNAIDAVNDFTRTAERERLFSQRIVPPLQITNHELDRAIPNPPFAWRKGAHGLVTVKLPSNYTKEWVDSLTAADWNEISQHLEVATVSPFVLDPLNPGKCRKRSQEEMDAEIRYLNEAAGYKVE